MEYSPGFLSPDIKTGQELPGPEKLHVAGRPIVEGEMAYLAPKT
jgi:hypothetical protein